MPKKPDNVLPMPVNNSLAATKLAAETLEADIWNLCIDQIDADMPTEWVLGILEKLKAELIELEYAEE